MISNFELREMRIKHGLTQEQAARMVYLTLGAYSRYELSKPTNVRQVNSYKARTELLAYKLGELEKVK